MDKAKDDCYTCDRLGEDWNGNEFCVHNLECQANNGFKYWIQKPSGEQPTARFTKQTEEDHGK